MKKILKILVVFFLLSGISCKEPLKVRSSDFQRIAIDNSIQKDEDLEELISPYRNKIKDEMEKPLAYNTKTMFKTDTPFNTAIGNMMADAVLEMANPVFQNRHQKQIDAVLLNYGGIRAGIGKGMVTTRTAYDIMPFENMVVIAELDGQQMKALIVYLSQSSKAQPIANMKLKFDANGEPLIQTINGKAFDVNKTYYVATSDYLVEGGDNMDFFLKANNTYDIDYKLRNLFIDYFAKQDTIDYTSDDRLLKLN